ncbi:hypothetical protein CLF_105600 [Clonorchis sinensis]|uniref:Uncharacterized protein n=1 Tax=Clonorchis sinensis TaxID=79923 RepID=G7YDS8_CLOSI|nr:hypothetical protein CLF_105600 [Clonorchis sinensis]
MKSSFTVLVCGYPACCKSLLCLLIRYLLYLIADPLQCLMPEKKDSRKGTQQPYSEQASAKASMQVDAANGFYLSYKHTPRQIAALSWTTGFTETCGDHSVRTSSISAHIELLETINRKPIMGSSESCGYQLRIKDCHSFWAQQYRANMTGKPLETHNHAEDEYWLEVEWKRVKEAMISVFRTVHPSHPTQLYEHWISLRSADRNAASEPIPATTTYHGARRSPKRRIIKSLKNNRDLWCVVKV